MKGNDKNDRNTTGMNEGMWYYMYIEDSVRAFASLKEIREELFKLMATSGDRKVAIFSRHDSETGGVHYYFSPPCRVVALTHRAIPCERPSRQQAGSLLFGDQDMVESLFE